jgi:hypothetical protein
VEVMQEAMQDWRKEDAGRGQEDQPGIQVNAALIAAQAGGSVEGASYTWRDPAPLAAGETRLYWLEEVELTGNTTQHGPLTVANAAHRLFLPGVFRR